MLSILITILWNGTIYGIFLLGLKKLVELVSQCRAYIRKVSECGHMAPPPTRAALTFLRWFCRVVVTIQVGKIKVEGAENLQGVDGPLLITPNHPHYADPGVVALMLDRIKKPARYLAAQRLFRFAWGLPSLACGPCGAISVDLKPGNGGPAREAAVRVLTSGQHLVMWPEAYAWMDGRLGPFRKGAVRIAREASRQIGKPLTVVPIHIKYGRNPGKWINRFDEPVQYLFTFLLWPIYRRGVTVVIGKPLPSTALPSDDESATEMLRAKIAALAPAR